MSKTLLDADFRGNTTLPTKPIIKLTSPTTTGILLVWAPSNWAASYQIALIDGTEVKLVGENLKQTFFEIPLATLKKEPQVFMIRAVNATGPGNWSTPITLTALGKPSKLEKLKLLLATTWKKMLADARNTLLVLCLVIVCEAVAILWVLCSTQHAPQAGLTYQTLSVGSGQGYTPPMPAGYLTDVEFNSSDKQGQIPTKEQLAKFDAGGRQPVEEAYWLPPHKTVTFTQCSRSDVSVVSVIDPTKDVKRWFNRVPFTTYEQKQSPEVVQTLSFRNDENVPVPVTFITQARNR